LSALAAVPDRRRIESGRRGSGRPQAVADAVIDTVAVCGRNLRVLVRSPQALVFAGVQPVMFVLLFRYAFGGAIRVPGVAYVDYLMPGIFAQTVAFGAMGTAVGLATDAKTGLMTRYRTLPVSRVAVLAGRILADLVRNVGVVTVMVGVGFAVGFRTHHGVPAFLAAIGLVALFAYALSWGFVALGLVVSDPEAAQSAGVPIMFVLVFSSAAFVPIATMPGWLQTIGVHQPVTALVDAERALLLGGPAAADVAATLAWSLGLLAGLVILAVLAYRRANR
jgi:ABC-2 type transport system permease protein/oleandomycin transport system permease protein